MDNNQKKLQWSTPKVERIDLKFDKEMAAACHGSNNTPSNKPSCGVASGSQSSCWNSQSG